MRCTCQQAVCEKLEELVRWCDIQKAQLAMSSDHIFMVSGGRYAYGLVMHHIHAEIEKLKTKETGR